MDFGGRDQCKGFWQAETKTTKNVQWITKESWCYPGFQSGSLLAHNLTLGHCSRDISRSYLLLCLGALRQLLFLFLHFTSTQTNKQSHHTSTVTMSAITDELDEHVEPLKVLIAMHDGMDSLSAIGVLETLGLAQHDAQNPGKYNAPPSSHPSRSVEASSLDCIV